MYRAFTIAVIGIAAIVLSGRGIINIVGFQWYERQVKKMGETLPDKYAETWRSNNTKQSILYLGAGVALGLLAFVLLIYF